MIEPGGEKCAKALMFAGVGVRLAVKVGVDVRVGDGVFVYVGVIVGEGVRVGVLLAVGVSVGEPNGAVTLRKVAVVGPHVWFPWKLFTPRPLTNTTCLPTLSEVVSILALTATVGEVKFPVIATGVPPAQGGVSM